MVQSGIQVLLWAGDADWICNWFGGLAVANAVDFDGSAAFAAKEAVNYTVDGVAGGTFKTEGNLSWLRVFGAGHEVSYYREFSRFLLLVIWFSPSPLLWSRREMGEKFLGSRT